MLVCSSTFHPSELSSDHLGLQEKVETVGCPGVCLDGSACPSVVLLLLSDILRKVPFFIAVLGIKPSTAHAGQGPYH